MKEDPRRRAGRLPGAKDLDGEAHAAGAGAIARLWYDQPPAFTLDLAGPVAIHPAGGGLESRRVGLSLAGRCEGAKSSDQRHCHDLAPERSLALTGPSAQFTHPARLRVVERR
jgi:hypothetical protein